MKPNDYFGAAKAVYLNLQADFVDLLRDNYKNTDMEDEVKKTMKKIVSGLELTVQCILLHIGLEDNKLSINEQNFIYDIGMTKNSLMEYIRGELKNHCNLETIAKQSVKERKALIEKIDDIILKLVDKIAILFAPIIKGDKKNEIFNTSIERLFFISEMFVKSDGQQAVNLDSVSNTINRLFSVPLMNRVNEI
ncbi:MAG: hypothetical protein K6E20_02610 [Acholeplasmatales bacterium]|nr:hypothetical protein [Acholeplasmatales bacterium]